VSVEISNSTAPIVKVAAGAVIILCAVGVAAMTGLLPRLNSQEKPAAALETVAEPAATVPVVTAPPPAIAKPVQQPPRAKPVAREQPVAKAQVSVPREPAIVERPLPVCVDCGVVQSIQPIEVKGEASGAGAVLGGVAGMVVGHQMGEGKGKTLAKVVGAAGGAYAGHQAEKNIKKIYEYQVAVRMNDGSYRTVTLPNADGLNTGLRVRVVGNNIVPD